MDLGSALARTTGAEADSLRARDALVREDAPDSVHQMRVSARRLRSVLQVYAPLLAEAPRREVADTLRELGRHLSVTRDAEVLRELLEQRLDALPAPAAELVSTPVVARLRRTAGRRHAKARTELLRHLATPDHAEDLDRVARYAQHPPLARGLTSADHADAAATLTPFALERMRDVRDDVADLLGRRGAEGRVLRLHELRKEANRVRYAVAAVEDATGLPLGHSVGAALRDVERLQTALGKHRDSVLLTDRLLRSAEQARAKGEDTLGYGVLIARELELQRRLLRRIRRRHRDL